MGIELTHLRCTAIRDRLYPKQEWPGVIHRDAVIAAGGDDRTLLEVGCGRDATALRKYAPHYQHLYGIDVEISEQPSGGHNLTLIRGDAHQLPLEDGSVDVVTMQDVVEHLEDPRTAFGECARVLRPGGVMIITTVNAFFPPIVASRLMPHPLRQVINRVSTGTAHEDTFPAYYRANTSRTLNGAARAGGLKLVDFRYLSHHPRYFMFSVVAYRAAVAVERVARRTKSMRGLYQFLHATYAKEG